MKYRQLKLSCFSLALFIFCSQQLLGQDCIYAKYDSLVNIARKNFKDKKSEKGKAHFQLAFETFAFPRGEDLNFALYKAREIKDDGWANELAEKLSKGGVPKRFFFQFKKEKWYSSFSQNFEDYSKFYQDNFNHDLRQKLLQLLDKDNNRVDRYHKWRTREIEMSLDNLIKEAKEVVVDFEKIIAKYGFPSEKMVGYKYVRRTNKVENYEVSALMIHMYQSGVRLFENSIPELMCLGVLPVNFENNIKKIHGLSDCVGLENEMKARYETFRGEGK